MSTEGGADLPLAPIHRLTAPLRRFLHVEASSGLVLLASTLVALALANSPWQEGFLAFWKTKVGFEFGGVRMVHSLQHWINDGLMAIFFFVIGLEVKRELVLGELRDPRRAALPVAAALGGMLLPVMVYLLVLGDAPGTRGWGIAMATDIAFVVGCMAVLGSRVPPGLRVTLLSLAIADDIGAILVIAVGYTDDLGLLALGLALAGLGLTLICGRLGIRHRGVYVLLGVLVWLAFHESGVHATLAGVALGLLTPARSIVRTGAFARTLDQARAWFKGDEQEPDRQQVQEVRRVQRMAAEAVSPLESLEHALHPWVGFVIMPLFALANAGVPIRMEALSEPVALAIAAGLVVGKPLGILSFSALATRLGLAQRQQNVSWSALAGGGLLAGIGFTMALFIASLALEGPLLDAAKVGILLGSAVAAVLGMLVLMITLPRRTPPPQD